MWVFYDSFNSLFCALRTSWYQTQNFMFCFNTGKKMNKLQYIIQLSQHLKSSFFDLLADSLQSKYILQKCLHSPQLRVDGMIGTRWLFL